MPISLMYQRTLGAGGDVSTVDYPCGHRVENIAVFAVHTAERLEQILQTFPITNSNDFRSSQPLPFLLRVYQKPDGSISAFTLRDGSYTFICP